MERDKSGKTFILFDLLKEKELKGMPVVILSKVGRKIAKKYMELYKKEVDKVDVESKRGTPMTVNQYPVEYKKKVVKLLRQEVFLYKRKQLKK